MNRREVLISLILTTMMIVAGEQKYRNNFAKVNKNMTMSTMVTEVKKTLNNNGICIRSSNINYGGNL